MTYGEKEQGIVVAGLHIGNAKKLHAAVSTVNSQWRLRDLIQVFAGTGEASNVLGRAPRANPQDTEMTMHHIDGG